MSDSCRTSAWILSAVLLAGVLTAKAQAESGRVHKWRTCDVVHIISDTQHVALAQDESPNFTVRILFHEQPISGVKVALANREPDQAGAYTVATGVTDSDGVAHFLAIPPGTYQAHVEGGLLAQSEEIVIEPGNTRSNEVHLEWPPAAIATQAVRGQISSWQRATPQSRSNLLPLAHVLVQLLDLRTAKLLASTHTSTAGYYEFSDVGEGLYVVRISEHPDPSINGYDKAVEVTRDAIRESLPSLVVDDGCQLLSELPDATGLEKAELQTSVVKKRTK